ncbi:glycosyltransferase family 2 protein [Planctomicrobium sp. SH661]|uniref:glycosyltransferase family 2 protein n=1 Tax=Planctomicrobium sp. SH661 TaxID=3448124 RepID=UPI003F5B88FC
MTGLELTFWGSLALIAYAYLGYPLLLGILARLQPRSVSKLTRPGSSTGDLPFVSLIIAAYKEESIILDRINNALLMDYPADRFEVLIGCDGNEDNTGELVWSVQDSRIKLMQFEKRRGKPSVLNDCVQAARGELIAFSDANTFWNRDALRKMVQHFTDPHVGGVCGQLLLVDPSTGGNVDGLYWKYENFLKRCEGKLGALLGFNGAIYAIRKCLWTPIPANTIVDDFVIGMRIHLQRQKVKFEETAIAHEESAPSISAEFHRRARIGAGGFQSLCWLAPLLNPLYGSVAFAFWSHKVIRWVCPLLMAIALATNLALIQKPLYAGLFVAQVLFYGLAYAGRFLPNRGAAGKVVKLTSMFVGMNAALAVGFYRWAAKSQSGAWKRTARTQELKQSPVAVSASNKHG